MIDRALSPFFSFELAGNLRRPLFFPFSPPFTPLTDHFHGSSSPPSVTIRPSFFFLSCFPTPTAPGGNKRLPSSSERVVLKNRRDFFFFFRRTLLFFPHSRGVSGHRKKFSFFSHRQGKPGRHTSPFRSVTKWSNSLSSFFPLFPL